MVFVFSAAGYVFVVNTLNGHVSQLSLVEALVVSEISLSAAADAMLDLILTGDESYLEEAYSLKDFSDALEYHIVESVLG